MEMKDNMKVSDSHKEGIGRVVQREHEKRDGHYGGMGGKVKSDKGFCVPNNAKTPRRA